MKAFFITVPVCLVAMTIVFAITKQPVINTPPVANSNLTETNKPISQEVIPQSDSTLTSHVNGTPVDTLNTGNKVTESENGLSSDSSSPALPSLSDQKPKSDDPKIKNKTSVSKIVVKAAKKKDDSIEFGDISPVNTPTSGIADKNADGGLVKKN